MNKEPAAPSPCPATAEAGPRVAVPFVVICHARTGSNLLLRALENHPNVATRGEALIDDQPTRDAIARSERRTYAAYQPQQDGAAFLDRIVFRSLDPTVRAAGFKQFFEYARWSLSMRSAWDYLVAERDIRLIHLARWNLLDCLVSHKVAVATGEWFREVDSGTEAPEPARLWLNPEECHAYFDRIVTWRLWVKQAFQGHPWLELDYNLDLCEDFAGTIARTLRFLDLEPIPVSPDLARQRTRSTRDQLGNFDELADHFRHTLYAEFFHERSRPLSG